jgi:hypothetical protein
MEIIFLLIEVLQWKQTSYCAVAVSSKKTGKEKKDVKV